MTTLRRLLILPVALVALAVAAPALAATDVQITKTAFVPSTVEIRAGDSVSWVNRDTLDHKLMAPAVKLESPTLTPTDNFAFAFPSAGTFTIPHPPAPPPPPPPPAPRRGGGGRGGARGGGGGRRGPPPPAGARFRRHRAPD